MPEGLGPDLGLTGGSEGLGQSPKHAKINW